MKKDIAIVLFVTLYLLIYSIIINLGAGLSTILIMFSISPILLIWMVLSVLKSKTSPQKTLKDDEEWGYGVIGRI